MNSSNYEMNFPHYDDERLEKIAGKYFQTNRAGLINRAIKEAGSDYNSKDPKSLDSAVSNTIKRMILASRMSRSELEHALEFDFGLRQAHRTELTPEEMNLIMGDYSN